MLYIPRRHHRKLLLIPGLLALILVWLPVASSWACSCIEIETSTAKRIAKAYQEADLIIIGKVIKAEPFTAIDTLRDAKSRKVVHIQRKQFIRYTFAVSRSLKGRAISTKMIITGDHEGNSCAKVFKTGNTYLVYSSLPDPRFLIARNMAPFYHTNLCDKTRNINSVKTSEIVTLERLKRKN